MCEHVCGDWTRAGRCRTCGVRRAPGKCWLCGEPEFVKRLGFCAGCYLAAGLHDNDVTHRCGKGCPGRKYDAALDAAKELP